MPKWTHSAFRYGILFSLYIPYLQTSPAVTVAEKFISLVCHSNQARRAVKMVMSPSVGSTQKQGEDSLKGLFVFLHTFIHTFSRVPTVLEKSLSFGFSLKSS